VRAGIFLRCAIALFILVDRGADEYVNRIYVPLHTILMYGLHIRLPPYQPGSKVPLHTILIYGLHIHLPPYQPGSKVHFPYNFMENANTPSKIVLLHFLWLVEVFGSQGCLLNNT
jgi:hypothetical protein